MRSEYLADLHLLSYNQRLQFMQEATQVGEGIIEIHSKVFDKQKRSVLSESRVQISAILLEEIFRKMNLRYSEFTQLVATYSSSMDRMHANLRNKRDMLEAYLSDYTDKLEEKSQNGEQLSEEEVLVGQAISFCIASLGI